MKLSELKLGDWVYAKNPITCEDMPCKVESLADCKILAGKIWFKLDELTPIPLTEEILEKNGWKERKHSEYTAYENGWYELFRVGQEGSWAFCHYDDFLASIEYIHQLQHLLWALGMDDDLKV